MKRVVTANITLPSLSTYDGNYAFPELCLPRGSNVSKRKIGLAFSGGGSRTMSAMIGYVRGLSTMQCLETHSTLVETASHVSSVSGGSWTYGTYAFARGQGISDDELLGLGRQPGDITMTNVKDDNIGPMWLGSRLTDADVVAYFLTALGSGVAVDQLWNYAIGRIFLEPYGLNADLPFLADEAMAQRVFSQNPSMPRLALLPDPMLPFWICNTVTMYPAKKIQIALDAQVTPMYSGITVPATATDGVVLGGVWVDTFAMDTKSPTTPPFVFSGGACFANQPASKSVTVVSTHRQFSLRDAIGTSSAAYADSVANVLPEYLHIHTENLIPNYDMWTPLQPGVTTNVPVGDGGFFENTGVIALVQRRMSHIIGFVNTAEPVYNADAPDDCRMITDIALLFGLPYGECNPGCCVDHVLATPHVFDTSQLAGFYQQLRDSFKRGGPTYAHAKLNVIDNEALGIKGGWVADVLLLVLAPSTTWENQLQPQLREAVRQGRVDKKGPFANFPNYKTSLQNTGKVFELTTAQVNLMANYTEWCITCPDIVAVLRKMYGGIDTTMNCGKHGRFDAGRRECLCDANYIGTRCQYNTPSQCTCLGYAPLCGDNHCPDGKVEVGRYSGSSSDPFPADSGCGYACFTGQKTVCCNP